MLTNLGLRLFLLIGNTVPLPASSDLMNALTNVEVTNDADQGDGFQLTFTMSKGKLLDYDILKNNSLQPFNRVIISVLIGVIPQILIDGIITHHQISEGTEPGSSKLTVTGKDLTIMLDLEEKNKQYKNMPDFLIVSEIIASYAQFGLIPIPSPTTDIPIELQRIPRQQETDFKFIKRLAEKNGYIFYIEPVTFGVNNAYWGPEIRGGIPQSALTKDMGSYTNLNSLNFSNDSLAPVGTSGTFLEPITKTSIPIPSLPSLKIPPLSSSPVEPKKKVLLRDTANQNPIQAAINLVASITRSPDPVTGTGEINTLKYGSVLRARKIVGVRGAGTSYDGFYYVKKVTHNISQGEYKQQFTISRDGTSAILPLVAP